MDGGNWKGCRRNWITAEVQKEERKNIKKEVQELNWLPQKITQETATKKVQNYNIREAEKDTKQ